MNETNQQYMCVMERCREIFNKKNFDYGTSWSVLRPSSLTDQLLIKAKRIRTLQQTHENRVGESIESEFVAIVNYCIIALIQFHSKNRDNFERINLSEQQTMDIYDRYAQQAYDLMLKKNHDYGQAWRDMRVSSITDFILTKILRIKQIEEHKGKTIASEGQDANYLDILNYAVFALILISETQNTALL